MKNDDRDPWTDAFEEYVNGLKDQKIKHLFFAENPLSLAYYIYYISSKEPKAELGDYFNAVYCGLKLFDEKHKSKQEKLEAMQQEGVLIWDIFHHRGKAHCEKCEDIKCGESIDSKKRTVMIEEGCTLAAFCESLNTLNDKGFTFPENQEDLNIYFMMPQLTSLPIFNYYNRHSAVELKIGGNNFSDRLKLANQLLITEPVITSRVYDSTIFPRHMINVIGGNNKPRPELVEHAFNNQT